MSRRTSKDEIKDFERTLNYISTRRISIAFLHSSHCDLATTALEADRRVDRSDRLELDG